ncbi:hypothetical protein GY45DRAFT_1323344 [Cubamyces sp. BRFM 1775]|nr:hypothetical protein GY45DRAFT_1323344 [Cubamyces sp. BRFM 1775]
MPHKRTPSTGTCEVVPTDGEPPCSQPGYRERPRLCNVHRKEYGRLTAAYKATSEEAEDLYATVRTRERTIKALHGADDIDDALEIGRKCLDAIEREIRERQDHHRRFFTEPHDGHEHWIDSLRKKRVMVERIISQLRHRHEQLLHGSSWELEHGVYAEEWYRDGSAELTSACPRTRRLSVAKPLGYIPPSLRHTMAGGKHIAVCVARLRLDEEYGGVSRCSARALPSNTLCTWHLDEYTECTSRSKAATQLCDSMIGDVRRILAKDVKSAYSTSRDVWQDLNAVTRFGSALDQVARCEKELSRFPGMAFKPYECIVDRATVYLLKHRLDEQYAHLAYNTRRANADAQKPYAPPTYQQKESYGTSTPSTQDAGKTGSVAVFLIAAAIASTLGMGVIPSVALGGFVAWAF